MRWCGLGWAVVGVGVLAGCTTVTKNEWKDAAAEGKVQRVALVWVQLSNVPMAITGQQGFQSRDSGLAKTGVGQIMALLQKELPGNLPKNLREKGACVTRMDMAEATLTISPKAGFTECRMLGCQNSLDLEVVLADRATKKPYWSAVLRTGAPWPSSQSESVAQDFYASVADKLVATKIIRPGICDVPMTDDLL